MMVQRLVESLLRDCPEVTEILVTKNISEPLDFASSHRVRVVTNLVPKSFGANHNAAFALAEQPLFCLLNPDIELEGNPFPGLLSAMTRTNAELVAPIVKTPLGQIDDSVRFFPTVFSLACKFICGADGRYLLADSKADINPEWVAGMFMLFKRTAFSRLGGFDEKFFLYYEDVDICVRAWKLHMIITVCPVVSVTHDARRNSRKNITHFRWHLVSMARYFWKHWGRLPRIDEYRSRSRTS